MSEQAGALHEVGNALTVVLGWLERASSTESLDEIKEAVAIAREHARRGRWMAREAIGAAVEHEVATRTAAELVRFAATSVTPHAEENDVKLHVEIGGGTDIRVAADPAILQILTNLLLNAIAFTPKNSCVSLSVRRSAEGVVFRVEDQGPGVPADVAGELFLGPVSRRRGGAGIGLPFSRALAAENGGHLSLVESPHDGRVGAVFELAWPSARSDAVGTSKPPVVGDLLKQARVLVIEDDASILSLIELSLEAYGAQVTSLSTFEEVQTQIQSGLTFDAALVDLSPLKDDLRSALDGLRACSPDAPVILMSGEPTGVPDGAEGRFSSWVRKPFDMDQLFFTLAQLLSERAPADSSRGSEG